jgi:hypothetical protein
MVHVGRLHPSLAERKRAREVCRCVYAHPRSQRGHTHTGNIGLRIPGPQAFSTASHPKTALSPILAIPPCAYVHSRLRHRLYRDRHLQRHFAAGSELYYRGYIRGCGHRSQVGDHHHHRFRSCQSTLSRCLPANVSDSPSLLTFLRNDVVVSVVSNDSRAAYSVFPEPIG